MYRFENTANPARHWARLVLCAGLLYLALVIAEASSETVVQYGFYSIAGILAMGVWIRLRLIISPPRYSLEVDSDRACWLVAGKEETVSWEEVSTLVLSRRNGTFLHFQKHDGTRGYVATKCLPEDDGELTEMIKEQVLPKHRLIIFHLDDLPAPS